MVDYIRKQKARYISFESLEFCTLKDVLENVQRAIANFGENATMVMMPQDYSDSDKEYPYVQYYTLETDKEMVDRIAYEERLERQTAERERAEFERLAKKFGK